MKTQETELRDGEKSGWLQLMNNPSMPQVVDIVLDNDTMNEFTLDQVVNGSGITRSGAEESLEHLRQIGVVVRLKEDPVLYRKNVKNPVYKKLNELIDTLE